MNKRFQKIVCLPERPRYSKILLLIFCCFSISAVSFGQDGEILVTTQRGYEYMQRLRKADQSYNVQSPGPGLSRILLRKYPDREKIDTIYQAETEINAISVLGLSSHLFLTLVWHDSADWVINPRCTHRIIDTTGSIVYESDRQFFSYGFDSTETRIVVITGTRVPETDFGFYSERLGIVNLVDSTLDWIIIADIPEGLPVPEYKLHNRMRQVHWASDGQIYVVFYQELYKLNLETGNLELTTIPGAFDGFGNFSVSPDGKFLLAKSASNGENGETVKVYDLNTEMKMERQIDSSLGRQTSWEHYLFDDPIKWFGPDGARLLLKVKRRYMSYEEGSDQAQSNYSRTIKTTDGPERYVIFDFNLGKVVYEEVPLKTKFEIHPWQSWFGSKLVEKEGKLVEFSLTE